MIKDRLAWSKVIFFIWKTEFVFFWWIWKNFTKLASIPSQAEKRVLIYIFSTKLHNCHSKTFDKRSKTFIFYLMLMNFSQFSAVKLSSTTYENPHQGGFKWVLMRQICLKTLQQYETMKYFRNEDKESRVLFLSTAFYL